MLVKSNVFLIFAPALGWVYIILTNFASVKEPIKLYDAQEVASHTRTRVYEQKLGEKIIVAGSDWQKSLKEKGVKFVIIGIAEDIGVRANHGRPGAASAFKPAVDSFLNQQANMFLPAEKICLLGEIVVEDLLEASYAFNAREAGQLEGLRELVKLIDARVAAIVQSIVQLKMIPIIIGGGHNNSYGNIKGSSLARGTSINVINCDPHMDFRPLEGRHSGNGFSYAFEEGYIDRYAVFGVHEQYNTAATFEKFSANGNRLFFNSYESIFVREEHNFKQAVNQCISYVQDRPCGIEIDLDAITNVPASAKTSSGISALQARQFVHQCATHLDPLYFHIAEGAPVLSHIKADNKTGKLIAYLITDFIKACLRREAD